MRQQEKRFFENIKCQITFSHQPNILLLRDCRHHMFWRISIFREERHSSKNASIFCFDIHAPFTRLDAVFRRIRTIASSTTSGNRDGNAICRHKGFRFIEGAPLPMMIDGCLKRDGCKDRREAIDRSIHSHSIIGLFPDRIPWTFFIGEEVFFMIFFNLMIDPSKF